LNFVYLMLCFFWILRFICRSEYYASFIAFLFICTLFRLRVSS
jgi:hypothetical protein